LALHVTHTAACSTTEKDYTGRNIYILSDSQAVIKDLDGFQIHSTFVWECYQSVEKIADQNRSKVVWVPGRMEIDVNEIAY
jgi:hypothetical protein